MPAWVRPGPAPAPETAWTRRAGRASPDPLRRRDPPAARRAAATGARSPRAVRDLQVVRPGRAHGPGQLGLAVLGRALEPGAQPALLLVLAPALVGRAARRLRLDLDLDAVVGRH